ncbi:hypothetical protein MD484_g7265, partial [Candolleomyces efflorescens]
MHNAELMKFWGPLINVSEYPYESHNGTLQRIKTNHHIWELDFTMLRNICRRGRLQALVKDAPLSGNSLLASALSVFKGGKGLIQSADTRTAGTIRHGHRVCVEIYTIILDYLNVTEPQSSFRHFNLVPHPLDANVLPDFAQHENNFEWKTRSYSTYQAHAGNSSVSFKRNDGSVGAGFIQTILQQSLQNKPRTFLIISPHLPLTPLEEPLNPYRSMPGFLASIVYGKQSQLQDWLVIEPHQLVGHVPFYRRSAGTFGIPRPTIIIINSLHRDR